MKKPLINLIIIILGIYLIINLSKDIIHLLKSTDRIKEAEQKLSQLENEHNELLKKKEYWTSDAFVEEEARNKLNLSKPGETVVVLPDNLDQYLDKKVVTKPTPIPIWRQWVNLFLN